MAAVARRARFVKARVQNSHLSRRWLSVACIRCHAWASHIRPRRRYTIRFAATPITSRIPVLKEFRERLERETRALDAAGLLKRELVIGSAQGPVVKLADGREMINLCANNYLGLANHPAVLQAAHDALVAIRLRRRIGALHLRHAERAPRTRGAAQRLPRDGGHDSVFVLLRRQRRPVRDACSTAKMRSSATR